MYSYVSQRCVRGLLSNTTEKTIGISPLPAALSIVTRVKSLKLARVVDIEVTTHIMAISIGARLSLRLGEISIARLSKGTGIRSTNKVK